MGHGLRTSIIDVDHGAYCAKITEQERALRRAQMRGPVLVERMRQSGKCPRVLFITGYSEEAVRFELDHPVLAKPFTLDALMLAIRSALQ